MTGTTRSSEGLDERRRRLLFRAWHRGMREMDLILGRFADANIDRLADRELDEFECLMDLPDGAGSDLAHRRDRGTGGARRTTVPATPGIPSA